MKRFVIIGLTLLLTVNVGCMKKKEITKPDCINSVTSNNSYSLTIIANQKEIKDKEAFAIELIEQVKNNDFHTTVFAYEEAGYPTGLQIVVYLDMNAKEKNKPFMKISFTQENISDGYNIVEDYEMFELEVE